MAAARISLNRMIARTYRLTALAVVTLLAIGLPQSRATAQGNGCEGNAWTAANEAELTTAIDCWEAANEPGAYSISLTERIFSAPRSIPAKTADFSLLIDGEGNALEDSLFFVGTEGLGPKEQSPLSLRDVAVRGDVTATRVHFTLSDTTIVFGGLVAFDAHLTVSNVSIDGSAELDGHEKEALRIVGSNAFVERSILASGFSVLSGAHPALSVTDSVLVVRNSIVRNSDGIFAVLQRSEVLFDRSLINDNDATAVSNWPCCAGSTVSYVNSTITGHDAQAPFNVTIGQLDGALINIANSTVINNGPHAVLGPIDTRSSIIDSCILTSERRPPADFTEGPINLGGNVGGCFGDGLIENFPLDDNGCAVPTIMGCVPTIATTPTSPARGSGECESTIIPDPTVDLFAIDVTTLPAGTDSALTTIGRQTLDGRGLPRTSCDSGAYESDGNEQVPPEIFTVATLDLDHPFSELNVLPAPTFYAEDIAEWAKDSSVDVLLLQRVASGPLGSNTIDALMASFQRFDHPMVYDYVPAFDLDPGFETSVGQVIFSRFPIVDRSSTVLPNPDPDGRPGVIQEVQLNGSVRIINVRSFDENPCDHVRALNDLRDTGWTTVLGGNLGADRTRDCVGEFIAGWVDACAIQPIDPLCERTIAPGAGIDDATQDYLLHQISWPFLELLDAETQAFFTLDPYTPHWPVVARYQVVTGSPGDADGDGFNDVIDNCPSVPGSQRDEDNDGIGDVCDPVLNADANCDGRRDIVDALVVAQFDAAVRSDSGQCPPDAAREIYAYAADVNDDGSTDIIDALLIAQCEAGITTAACPFPPPN